MLVEFPPATVRLRRFVLPAAGGGYLRLFPYWWTRLALRTFERERTSATCYLHPYEIDTSELNNLPYRVPTFLRWSQGTNRQSVLSKLRWLLSEFRFVPMGEAFTTPEVERLAVGLDLGRSPVTYKAAVVN
jgi:hypothetical protein